MLTEDIFMGGQQTEKKVKYVGVQQYINANTGEIENFCVTSIEERDYNFYKVWMRNFVSTLDIVGNQKTRLCFWIIDHLNKENQLLYTYRQIATATNMSLETIRITMKILLEADFLRRINQGCYIVNPDVLFKGSRNGRMNILNQYHDTKKETEKISDEERLAHLLETIEKLKKEASDLNLKIKKNNVKTIKSA